MTFILFWRGEEIKFLFILNGGAGDRAQDLARAKHALHPRATPSPPGMLFGNRTHAWESDVLCVPSGHPRPPEPAASLKRLLPASVFPSVPPVCALTPTALTLKLFSDIKMVSQDAYSPTPCSVTPVLRSAY